MHLLLSSYPRAVQVNGDCGLSTMLHFCYSSMVPPWTLSTPALHADIPQSPILPKLIPCGLFKHCSNVATRCLKLLQELIGLVWVYWLQWVVWRQPAPPRVSPRLQGASALCLEHLLQYNHPEAQSLSFLSQLWSTVCPFWSCWIWI